MNPRSLVIGVAAIAAIALGTWTYYSLMSPPPAPRVATVLPSPAPVPDFSLLDHHGQPVGREVFEGQWDLVFFGFTHCPDICPLTLQVLGAARHELAEAGEEVLPRVVLVSVDPERDTPEQMDRYVGYFGDHNLGITGELAEVRKLTDGLGVFFEKTAERNGNYSVDHSSVVLLLNPDGEMHALFTAPHNAGNFVHDLPIIMAVQ